MGSGQHGPGSPPGRYTYYTPEEARRVAEELGLSDVHSHQIRLNGRTETVFGPASSHAALNQRLRSLGLQPAPMPAATGHGESGSGAGVDLGWDDDEAARELDTLFGGDDEDRDSDRSGFLFGF